MRLSKTLLVLTLTSCGALLVGCAPNYEVRFGNRHTTAEHESRSEYDRDHAKPGRLGIPPGHLPGPGQCRIWIPGVPPGHQDPPGNCATLAARVPRGAWLISRDHHDDRHVRVNVYHATRPDFVFEVRLYEANSGVFVRWEK